MKGTTGRNSALLGVQWRFLSNDVARGEVVKDELSEAPFSDEAVSYTHLRAHET